jgi:hypothetical protein
MSWLKKKNMWMCGKKDLFLPKQESLKDLISKARKNNPSVKET